MAMNPHVQQSLLLFPRVRPILVTIELTILHFNQKLASLGNYILLNEE